MELLTDIIADVAQKYPHKRAMSMRMGYRTVRLTYAQLYDMARRFALFLQSQGCKPKDNVLLLAPNSPYWSVVFFGTQLAGAVPVPLNVQSTSDQVARVANQTEATLIIAHTFYRQELPGQLKCFNIELIPELIESFDVQNYQPVELCSDDLAQILYTSGTTGDPKGVMLSHANISSGLHAIYDLIALRPCKDRLLSILPLSHILEQVGGLMVPMMFGAHIVYTHSPAAIRELMAEHHINKMIAVPEFLQIFMSRIEQKAEEVGSSRLLYWFMKISLSLSFMPFSRILFWPVRRILGGKLDTVVSGGAPLDPELEKKWNALGIYLLQGYGLTETSPTVSTNTFKERRLASVGKVVPGVEVKLADDGEILVKGPNVFKGYYKNEELTRKAFTADGWFKTTDLGEFDNDGFLYIRGRKKYVIIGPGGQNVFPEDIEWELHKIAGVKDCTVLGLERAHGMIEIHAVLLLEDNSYDAVEIIKKANELLASYQQISGWSVWPEPDFPRSATRKVQKEKVKAHVLAQENGEHAPQPLVAVSPLITILSHITGVDVRKIHADTKVVSELQLDSLRRVELVARIEDSMAVVIDETKITGTTTVAQLQDMIEKQEPVKELPRLKRWPRSWWAHMLRPIGQYLLWFILRLFVRLRVKGLEHLRGLELPAVFMPNHITSADAFLVTMALPWRVRSYLSFAGAYDMIYEYYRYLAWPLELFFNVFSFPRKEGENIKHGLDNMGRMLDQGYSVVVFPEGRISPTGDLLPLKGGAGVIALSMDSYVVPVNIDGAQKIFPYYTLFPRTRATVTITFGKPIKFSRLDSYEQVKEVISEQMKALSKK